MTEEAVIVEWKKDEGDHIEKGEVIADAEGAKDVEGIESPQSGTLKKIKVGEGEETKVGSVIALLETEE